MPSASLLTLALVVLAACASPPEASRHVHPSYADGTQWTVEVDCADRTVRASGSNRYPGPRGARQDAPDKLSVTYTSEFDAVLSAVGALSGPPFE